MTRRSAPFGLLLFLLSACSAPEPAPVSVQLVSDSGRVAADVDVVTPVIRGSNELYVQLTPLNGSEAALVAVDAAMVTHGHRSHADRIDQADGLFHVGSLELFMTGRWLIELTLEVDGEVDHASLPVDVP
ncbi:MAG: hypothetical protein EOO73_16655 [Myxococcales bacterium]|nr:MAG: hypothetical protein EOO73_16655 [Myxococcales bacterium]